MELSELINLAETYLNENRKDPHQIAAFKYHIEKLINQHFKDIPFDELELNELKVKREQFEEALKNAHSLSNEVLIRHQLKEIEERILAITRDRSKRRTIAG